MRRGRLTALLDDPADEHIREDNRSGATSSTEAAGVSQERITTEDNARRPTVAESSEDELSKAAPTRRLLLKRKRTSTSVASSSARPSRGASPSSSIAGRVDAIPPSGDAHADSDANSPPQASMTDGKNKFLALVEKHRKQRLAMEAAEVAKRAARVEQINEASKKARSQRGSSMADSSGDDTVMSDENAGSRLAKEARPTRKASKKAIEEMNRETQRMSRNMQLAHQARTKKKITKESLLTLFNFTAPEAIEPVKGGPKSLTASSASPSDAEDLKEHHTPPTSPPQEDDDLQKRSTENTFQLEELPQLDEIMAQPNAAIDKGKGRAADYLSEAALDIQKAKQVRSIRVKWTKEDAVMARAADSDSDLEIITSQSKTRKYAVFERMPSRKAHETESHLLLRNLAHLGSDNRDKKRSLLNTAEMEASLRRAARLQAQRERQEKLEELKAKGIVIQTSEEREREQQEVEDLVERARQEGAEIQKREKEAAKKDGTYVKDTMDDDDDDEEDGDFEDEEEVAAVSGSEADPADGDEAEESEDDHGSGNEFEEPDEDGDGTGLENENGLLVDEAADEQDSEDASSEEDDEKQRSEDGFDAEPDTPEPSTAPHKPRQNRVILDDDDEDEEAGVTVETPAAAPAPAKTPQSITHSARKIIPGLEMSNDLPIGLTQAFAATMADSQSPPPSPETQEEDSIATIRDLPSPNIPFMPQLRRLDSIDVVSDSQPATQTQPLNLNFDDTQQLPHSPAIGLGISGTPLMQSQMPFEPTQDAGYMFSPFAGSRFGADTPQRQEPHSTIDTIILSEGSPLLQRKGRLRRGQAERAVIDDEEDSVAAVTESTSAFDVMHRAAKHKATLPDFDKAQSHAKNIVDEAAEESEDEYAGLGGASDDDVGEEDEDDRQMIDHDTQVGRGDEAKLAGLYADRERQQDEVAVSKLLKDITTGALRRKRGVGDDLDLSDEEDEAARRREAKRREYAKMRRELFKDEAVEKISEDKKKEAFLKSIEDREEIEDEDDEQDLEETQQDDSQSQQLQDEETQEGTKAESAVASGLKRKRPLEVAHESSINRLPPALRRGPAKIGVDKKPSTLAEIRDSVSFLIEEPDSQSMTIDLGLSDSDDEPEKYLDLDRHLKAADENEDDDGEDLGDFVVDDSQKDDSGFKMPGIPASSRAPYTERRTKQRNVVDRLSLMRQASSSSTSSRTGGKMAFFASKTSAVDMQMAKVPSLLRRATTNSSFGSMAGREESATGVTVTKERGHAGEEKAFVRKGMGGQRNAVNYRVKPAETQMSERAGVRKTIVGKAAKSKKGGFLGGLFRGDSWA